MEMVTHLSVTPDSSLCVGGHGEVAWPGSEQCLFVSCGWKQTNVFNLLIYYILTLLLHHFSAEVEAVKAE